MQINVIEARDHYMGSGELLEPVILVFVGEFLKEDETYIYLRHISQLTNHDEDEIDVVMKSAVIKRQIIEADD